MVNGLDTLYANPFNKTCSQALLQIILLLKGKFQIHKITLTFNTGR